MALVIEDGSIVAGADSFATVAEFATYATNYGRTVTDDTDAVEALLRRAALQMGDMPWKGYTANREQALCWPRYSVMANGWEIPSSMIPPRIKAGQMALACELYADDQAPAELKSGPIVSEKVGPLETTYAAAPSSVSKPVASRQSQAQFAQFLESASSVRLTRA